MNSQPLQQVTDSPTAVGRRTRGPVVAWLAATAVACVACGSASAQTLYWRGATNLAWNGALANWTTDKAGTITATSFPTTTTDVIFAWNGASGNLATTLGTNFSIDSLTFETGTATPANVTIGPGANPANALTIGAGGITLSASAPTVTISAPVVLGANQSWSLATGRGLDVSGAITGSGTLTRSGVGGILTLSASNSFSGGMINDANVGGSTRVNNDYALGTGTVTVVSSTLGLATTVAEDRSLANDFVLSGAGARLQWDTARKLTLTGTIVQTGGSGNISNTVAGGTIALPGQLFLTAAGDSTARTLTINAVGPIILSGTLANGPGAASGVSKSTSTGPLTVTGSMGMGGNLVMSHGLLDVNGGAVTTGSNANVGTASNISGLVVVRNGGSFTARTMGLGGISAAGTGRGSFVVAGGIAALDAAATGITIGGNNANIGYGSLLVSSGTLESPVIDLQSTSTSGSSVKIARVDGGRLTNSGSFFARSENYEITVTGGTMARSGATANIALGSANSGTGTLNLVGGLIDNTGRDVTVRQTSGTPVVGINVNAGRLITNGILVTTTGAGIVGVINFNGGTVEPGASGGTLVASSMTAAYVNGAFGAFAGGAVVDTNGKNTTIAAALVAPPSGNGLSGLSLTASGSNYIGAPLVRISGGGGTGAAGYADVDLDPDSATFGRVTGVVLTNPGVGYTTTPTIELLGGGGTGAVVAPGSLVANTSGGLVKRGAGTLTLSASNTYTGPTTVEAGTLALGAAASIGSSGSIWLDATTAGLDVAAQPGGGIMIASGRRVGGIGTVTGGLALDSGALFSVDPAALALGQALTVTGAATLANSFGIASLVGVDGSALDWSLIATGTHTLIATDSTFNNIGNFGPSNPADIDGGRKAYFENGSLRLVVVVPEPTTLGIALAGLAGLAWHVRRRGRR